MLGISKTSPYRAALMQLINSIDEEISLTKENAVLLVIHLDTEEKIIKFNDWVKSKLEGEKFTATEAQVMNISAKIHKGII